VAGVGQKEKEEVEGELHLRHNFLFGSGSRVGAVDTRGWTDGLPASTSDGPNYP
jgi:hypothetical protein